MSDLLPRSVSTPSFWRKALMALGMVGATLAAFYWGRLGTKVDAQQVQPRAGTTGQPVQPQSDYGRRVVAYIYENMPISREDLGEYLIARFGRERVEFLINRRIVEMACQAKGIYVTDGEVEVQFKEELKAFGPTMNAQEFTNQVLKRFNKSLFEWKEDVIRPKLLLAKLCKPMVEVTQQDLVNAYEARYGPKVQCRMIAFQKGDKHMSDTWAKINQSEEEFAKQAKAQFLPELAAKGGEIPPIHKHFGDAKVESAAFNLQPGQTTPLMEMPDGTYIVLKCDKHLLADVSKNFDSVRLDLDKEMREIKLSQKIPEYFAELRKQANPRVLITNEVRQEDLERDVKQLLSLPGNATPRATGPTGN
jgi:hypothetical protein